MEQKVPDWLEKEYQEIDDNRASENNKDFFVIILLLPCGHSYSNRNGSDNKA